MKKLLLALVISCHVCSLTGMFDHGFFETTPETGNKIVNIKVSLSEFKKLCASGINHLNDRLTEPYNPLNCQRKVTVCGFERSDCETDHQFNMFCLFKAILEEDKDTLRLMIDENPDLLSCKQPQSLMYFAVSCGITSMVEFLFELGFKSSDWGKILKRAASLPIPTEIFNIMHNYDVPVNASRDGTGLPPIFATLWSLNRGALLAFTKLPGFDINIKNRAGFSLLDYLLQATLTYLQSSKNDMAKIYGRLLYSDLKRLGCKHAKLRDDKVNTYRLQLCWTN